MLFVIYSVDDPSTPNARNDNYPEHRIYLKSAPIKILIAVPYMEKTSEKIIGSMLLIEASGLGEAEAFAHEDPFHVKKVWSEVYVNPYTANISNR